MAVGTYKGALSSLCSCGLDATVSHHVAHALDFVRVEVIEVHALCWKRSTAIATWTTLHLIESHAPVETVKRVGDGVVCTNLLGIGETPTTMTIHRLRHQVVLLFGAPFCCAPFFIVEASGYADRLKLGTAAFDVGV